MVFFLLWLQNIPGRALIGPFKSCVQVGTNRLSQDGEELGWATSIQERRRDQFIKGEEISIPNEGGTLAAQTMAGNPL